MTKETVVAKATPVKVSPQHERIRRKKSFTQDLLLRQDMCDPSEYPEEISSVPLLSQRPCRDQKSPTTVQAFVLIKKIKEVCVKTCTVTIKFIVALEWEANHLIGKRVSDLSKLWVPPVEILDADNIDLQKATPSFYPKYGIVRQLIFCDGTITNHLDLKSFPFDFDDISIKLCGSVGTGDREVKLMWQEGRDASTIAPTQRHSLNDVAPHDDLENQLMEWSILSNLTRIERMKETPGFYGKEAALKITVFIARKYGFYMWKIMFILTTLVAMSWTIFSLDSLFDRLDLLNTLLLASVAFLYMVSEVTPRLSYLTTIDKMILGGFVNMLVSAFVSFVCEHLSRKGWHETAVQIENVLQWFIPVCYIIYTYGLMAMVLYFRDQRIAKEERNHEENYLKNMENILYRHDFIEKENSV